MFTWHFDSNLAEVKSKFNEILQNKEMPLLNNMNSDVMQQWRTHNQSFQKGRDSIVLFGLTCFVVIEKLGKQEPLNHYRIMMDVADQKPYRSGHTTPTI